MAIELGQIAPDFEQDTTNGSIRFHEWLHTAWGVLFSHSRDFAAVCMTELAEVARLKPEWERRNVKPIGLSLDPAEHHQDWEADFAATLGQRLNFPLLADEDRRVSNLYGMIHDAADATVTVRSLIIIDPRKTVRLTLAYPASTGRNFAEVLRVIDSLQLADAHEVETPANWRDGEAVIIAHHVADAEAKQRFPEGWTALNRYLRLVAQPPLPRSARGRMR